MSKTNRSTGDSPAASQKVSRPAPELSRRSFLSGAVMGTAGLWIQAASPRPLAAEAMGEPHASGGAAAGSAKGGSAPTRHAFTAAEWTEVEAMTGRILPTDETPGAIEAGCVRFIDRALANEDAHALPLYRQALAALETLCQARRAQPFSAWTPKQQDALLHELEAGAVEGWEASEADPAAFFATLRMHTLLGFVLDPSYGGNQDYIGWKTMGFPGPVHHLGGSQPDQMSGERAFVPIWERVAPGHSKA